MFELSLLQMFNRFEMLIVFMPQVSIYLNAENLQKMDNVRGLVKRSTMINEVLNKLDEPC